MIDWNKPYAHTNREYKYVTNDNRSRIDSYRQNKEGDDHPYIIWSEVTIEHFKRSWHFPLRFTWAWVQVDLPYQEPVPLMRSDRWGPGVIEALRR